MPTTLSGVLGHAFQCELSALRIVRSAPLVTTTDHCSPILPGSPAPPTRPPAVLGRPSKPLTRAFAAKNGWARRDSNPHAQGQQGLSPLCLPVSPRALWKYLDGPSLCTATRPPRASPCRRICVLTVTRGLTRHKGAGARPLVACQRGDSCGAGGRPLLLPGFVAPAMGG